MNRQREVDENHLTQQPPCLINNTHLCFEENHPLVMTRKNNTFYSKEKHKNTKEAQRTWEKDTYITKRRTLPEEASIQTVALKEIRKRENKRWVIYRFSELYAVHRIQQRKSSNTKPNI